MTSSVAVGSTISIGFTFSGGSVVAPTALVFNGQLVAITNPVPTPTPTPSVGETQSHGLRATLYVCESFKLGMIPFFAWYNLNGTGDSFYTDTANIQNDTFMQRYFADIVTMFNLAKTKATTR